MEKLKDFLWVVLVVGIIVAMLVLANYGGSDEGWRK